MAAGGRGPLAPFADALRGIARSVRTERHLRIHLTALCYVIAAGWLAEVTPVQWAVLILCCGGVIAAELLNTALEALCDTLHPAPHPGIGAAKDAAAGAVLVLALASLGVAAVVFGPWLTAGGLVRAARVHPWLLPAGGLSLVAAGAFILLPERRRGQDSASRERDG